MAMKGTFFCFGCVLLSLFLLAGCSTKHTAPASDDRTAPSSSTPYLAGTKEDSDWLEGKTIMEVPSVSDFAYDTSLQTLSEMATDIVIGTVQDTSYTDAEGHAWTATRLKLDQIIKGTAKTGDTIEIYALGGYIPLEKQIAHFQDGFRYEDMTEEEIKNTVIHEIVNGEDTPPAVGKQYLFYLVHTPDYSPLPKNVYERFGGAAAQFALTEGGSFRREAEDNTEETYSLRQIQAYVK